MSQEENQDKKTAVINLDGKGLAIATTLQQQSALADRYLAAGMLPKNYTSVGQVITAWHFAAEFGLPLLVSLRQIAVINGMPSIWGDLPLAICRNKDYFEWIDEMYFDKDLKEISWANKNLTAEIFGAICIVKRKGSPKPIERFFTINDAKKAGLFSKSGPWTNYTKDMLMYKARSRALKAAFPDAISGFSIAESDLDAMPRYDNDGALIIDVADEARSEPEKTKAIYKEIAEESQKETKKDLLEKIKARLKEEMDAGMELSTIQDQIGPIEDLGDKSVEQLYTVLEMFG